LQNCREKPYTLSTKSLAKALAIFWIEKGFGSQFLDLPKLRFLDDPGTSRPRTPFSVATPNRFAGLLSVVAAKAEFIGIREKLRARLGG
jgi:hypothetical protein